MRRAAGAAIVASGRGIHSFLRLALGTTAGRIGLPIVAIHLFVAVLGPSLAPYPANEFHLQNAGEHQLIGPSSLYWLGTDQYGRDIFSRVLTGAGSLISIASGRRDCWAFFWEPQSGWAAATGEAG